MAHTEILVKVNAWVDAKIAPVVAALSAFPEVETFSSCEGDGHVYFNVRGGPESLYSFVNELASHLADELESCCEFKLQMEWLGGHPVHGALYVATGAAEPMSRALDAVIRRKTSCSDGTAHTDAGS